MPRSLLITDKDKLEEEEKDEEGEATTSKPLPAPQASSMFRRANTALINFSSPSYGAEDEEEEEEDNSVGKKSPKQHQPTNRETSYPYLKSKHHKNKEPDPGP
jgi:hypothetical protein